MYLQRRRSQDTTCTQPYILTPSPLSHTATIIYFFLARNITRCSNRTLAENNPPPRWQWQNFPRPPRKTIRRFIKISTWQPTRATKKKRGKKRGPLRIDRWPERDLNNLSTRDVSRTRPVDGYRKRKAWCILCVWNGSPGVFFAVPVENSVELFTPIIMRQARLLTFLSPWVGFYFSQFISVSLNSECSATFLKANEFIYF